LLVAPINMRQRFEDLIRREIDHATHGREAGLVLKMNALEDSEMIRLLYQASQLGVKVDLLVRGICCLRPGIEGLSGNIRVTSIVGRFLEHSRIYYFRNAGHEEMYLGSADLMARNLNHRVELMFPVEDKRAPAPRYSGHLSRRQSQRADHAVRRQLRLGQDRRPAGRQPGAFPAPGPSLVKKGTDSVPSPNT
jgi:polyphosphate kinase